VRYFEASQRRGLKLFFLVFIIAAVLVIIVVQLRDIKESIERAAATDKAIIESLEKITYRLEHIHNDASDRLNDIKSQIETNQIAAEDNTREALSIQSEVKQSIESAAESIERLRRLSYDTFTLGLERVITSIEKDRKQE
jgi:predicted PurR-regulated permease PerM